MYSLVFYLSIIIIKAFTNVMYGLISFIFLKKVTLSSKLLYYYILSKIDKKQFKVFQYRRYIREVTVTAYLVNLIVYMSDNAVFETIYSKKDKSILFKRATLISLVKSVIFVNTFNIPLYIAREVWKFLVFWYEYGYDVKRFLEFRTSFMLLREHELRDSRIIFKGGIVYNGPVFKPYKKPVIGEELRDLILKDHSVKMIRTSITGGRPVYHPAFICDKTKTALIMFTNSPVILKDTLGIQNRYMHVFYNHQNSDFRYFTQIDTSLLKNKEINNSSKEDMLKKSSVSLLEDSFRNSQIRVHLLQNGKGHILKKSEKSECLKGIAMGIIGRYRNLCDIRYLESSNFDNTLVNHWDDITCTK